MQTLRFDNQIIWFDQTMIDEKQVQFAFDADYWREKNCIVGSASGRGTTWFVQLDSTQAALRHYRRGGLFSRLIEDSYWFSGEDNTRSFQELMLLNYLRESNVHVPRPIAARVVKSGFTYRADLLSEKVADSRDLVAILKEKPLTKTMYQKIGDEIRKMHAAQVNHTDLNIHNILIDSTNKVWIIDFDKCYQQQGDTWKLNNWERLKRSFEKERLKSGILWTNAEFSQMTNDKTNVDD